MPDPILAVRRASLAVVVFIAGTLAASAQTTLRSVAAATVGDEAVVTIEASGALPPPTVGALDGPPRIFLDFAGVTPATSGLSRTRDSRVRRVRVALNSATPPVTRVVIDLTAVLPHRVDLAAGRAMVFIGAGTPAALIAPATRETADSRAATALPPGPLPVKPPPQPSAAARPPASSAPAASDPAASSTRIPPVPPLPPPMPDANDLRSGPRTPSASSSSSAATSPASTTASRPPYRPPAAPPPARDIEKYRADANPLLDRFKLQLPLLEQMESLDGDLSARMPMAMLEFDRLREELGAIKPPDTLRTQHDLLMQAARLATTAAQLRLEAVQSGNDAVRRNAASAAAGASLMLERVFAELGFNQNP